MRKNLNMIYRKSPFFFCKSPSSLIPHEGEIYIPSWLNSRVDHEAELALVLGKQGKNIPEEHAIEFIAGYTILNDVTARSMQKEDLGKRNPWFRSKSIDTFCPLGPYLIPVDEIEDPHNLDIKLMVNGQTKQKSNTSFMIFKIPAIISYVSKYMTLQPGDIIATGTPEGVSPIKNEDVIEITISEIGTLKNNVVTEETIKK